jgi:uncharacterized protein (DUF362 family)/NAD-dependent dihydropyrimidine dehydrogenase PreA subunit
MHRVMIQQANYEDCRRAIDSAFELFPIDVRGKKVLVKPNVLRAADPEQGIATHPAVVLAVVEKLEELKPAAITVGDNPGAMSYGDNEKAFRRSGLMEAAKGYYQNISGDAVEVDFVQEFLDTVSVSRAVLEADVFISVPKFKTHGLTVITGAIKNSYGIIPGALKARLHSKAWNALLFNRLIVDVFSLRIPDFFIVDAVVGMEGNGPASPNLREIGKILASDNGVALDATIARMMGVSPQSLPFLETARQRSLGDYEEESIEIVGDLNVIPDFKVPPAITESTEMPSGIREFFLGRVGLRPSADRDLCTSCETCIEQCPASALVMDDGLPVVDPEKCITCFCCQEICPEMAIALR